MTFSVQNSNLMYSVDFSPDLVQIQVRETVSEFFWHEWTSESMIYGGSDAKGLQKHHITQVPMTEKQLEEMQMMEEVAEHVGMNYPDTPDSKYVAQPVNDFLFPWEEAGSAENPITLEEDERFSETRTPSPP